MNASPETEITQPSADTRLHLYFASGCPFCHRVLAALAVTGLDTKVTYSWMRNVKGAEGWEIDPEDDAAFGEQYLSGVYAHFDPSSEHRPSVPLLVDLSTNTLLSNSSSDMTRYFAKGMNGKHEVLFDLCPADLVQQIDVLNEQLHETVNRAVYLVGFATEQADYEKKVADLFATLDVLDQRLSDQPYLLGDKLTESDLYFLATLVRFDSVYYRLFKCSYRFISDYPAISAYLERLEGNPGIKDTVERECYKEHYFLSVMHVRGGVRDLNPSRIIPVDHLTQASTGS